MEYPSSPVPSPVPAEETPTQKQARLRRERREAKIMAGGSARLDKITSLSGRPAEAEFPTTSPNRPTSNADPAFSGGASTGASHGPDDPEEVDISRHPYTPGGSDTPRSGQAQTDAARQFQQLRQMMAAGNNGAGAGDMPDSPFATPDFSFVPDQRRQQQQRHGQQRQQPGGMGMPMPQGDEDPLARILQQMMGGMSGGGPGGGGDGGGGGADGLPPGLAAMFGGGVGGAQAQQAAGGKYVYIWKIVHAVFALALGIYITTVTAFSGSRISRTAATAGLVGNGGDVGVRFFWVFATAELVLQSSRFFMEKGRASQSGLLATVAGFLPEPYRGYLGLVGRYSGIWNTVVQDAMVVIFVLGCVAWWKGAVS